MPPLVFWNTDFVDTRYTLLKSDYAARKVVEDQCLKVSDAMCTTVINDVQERAKRRE